MSKRPLIDRQLKNQMSKYFGVVYGYPAQELQTRIDYDSLVRYGRLRMLPDNNRVRTAAVIDSDPTARDNSYIKVCILSLYFQ